jgi:hypothetical protein
MMIRVRAWNSASKEMFSPETMAEDQLTLLPTGQFINVNSASTRLSVIYPIGTMVPMLSSGLRDKNGVEIFGGDICRYTDYDGKVYIQEMHPISNYHFWGHVWENLDGADEGQNPYEVIGDIHQSPELLKSKRPLSGSDAI